jgi:hypothetical protein
MATEEVDFGSSFGKGLEGKKMQRGGLLKGSHVYTMHIGRVADMEKIEHARVVFFKFS